MVTVVFFSAIIWLWGLPVKKTYIYLFLLILCFQLTGCKKQENVQISVNPDDFGIQYVEDNGGFSIYAPKGWQLVEGDSDFLIMMGDVEDNFTPNITFNLMKFGGKVSELIDAGIVEFPNIFTNFKLLDRGSFTISNGIKGEYILTQSSMGNLEMRQKMYLLPNKKNTEIMAIYCTVSPATGGKYDLAFDDSVKTFNWK
jgi:hypothetical protein